MFQFSLSYIATITHTLAGSGVAKSQSEGTISQRAQASVPIVEPQQYVPQTSVPMQNSPYMVRF